MSHELSRIDPTTIKLDGKILVLLRIKDSTEHVLIRRDIPDHYKIASSTLNGLLLAEPEIKTFETTRQGNNGVLVSDLPALLDRIDASNEHVPGVGVVVNPYDLCTIPASDGRTVRDGFLTRLLNHNPHMTMAPCSTSSIAYNDAHTIRAQFLADVREWAPSTPRTPPTAPEQVSPYPVRPAGDVTDQPGWLGGRFSHGSVPCPPDNKNGETK